MQNEDSLGTLPLPNGHALVVCDGMGGSRRWGRSKQHCRHGLPVGTEQRSSVRGRCRSNGARGEDCQPGNFPSCAQAWGGGGDGDHVGGGIIAARGTGAGETSLTLSVVNVGDSRAYLFRDQRLQQITKDHSHVAHLLSIGAITPAQAANFPGRNVVTRALGSEPSVRPDLFQLPLQRGDLLLLCSDGLHSEISDERIAEILRSNPQLETACDALVVAALAAGGRDNITVILARMEEGAAVDAATAANTLELASTAVKEKSDPKKKCVAAGNAGKHRCRRGDDCGLACASLPRALFRSGSNGSQRFRQRATGHQPRATG
ncbi:MAG: serine/threonine protein phosphatase [Chlorobi bacterium OLB7]|nr:MAG: serine/threonine protein phosphatase [Chlorobi bacterium OLB7]